MFAFRSPLSKGAILADEVGLGKTIEAGLVISQKWAEQKRKILIIVPANLRKQWSQELLDKFFLPSIIIENATFNQAIKEGNLNPFERKEVLICSYQFARKHEAYIRLIHWDLVVIDEAHRLRNVYKPSNKIANAIRNAVAHAPKILLTATPLQNSILELYGLVSVIDEFHFGDVSSFRSQYSRLSEDNDNELYQELKQRLKPICHRTLRRQVLEYIKFTNRVAIVEEFYPTDEEQKLYDLVSEYLQRPDLFALPKSQRSLMTLILRKLLASSTFAISGTLEALSNKLNTLAEYHDVSAQIAPEDLSDFEAVKEFEDEWEEDDENETADEPKLSPQQIGLMKQELDSLKEFHKLADSIRTNSKGEKLITALRRGFAEAERLGAQRKAIIFTESLRTQNYLKQILEANGYSGQLVLFNGSNNDPESREIYRQWLAKHEGTDRITGSDTADKRAALVEYFRDHATIMIATEAAAEGINLQFCSLVVNYDLPWNPQRIEQRIGRCHRYGQKYDVVVVNFLNKANAADQRVYELLDQKFKLFDGVFGASDEVLGSIESGLDFEKRIAKIYQECRTTDEIQTSFDQLQLELEGKISTELSKTKQKLLENFDEEVHEKLRINLKESEDYLTKYERWLWDITRYYLKDCADFEADGFGFTLRKNPFAGETIHPGPYRIGKSMDDVNIYRINHPLAQRIIEKCRVQPTQTVSLAFVYSTSGKKITILDNLIGKRGWLTVKHFSISTFDTEDHVLLAGCTHEGDALSADQCRRFFSLSASIKNDFSVPEANIDLLIGNELAVRQNEILAEVSTRNAAYFEQELEKLDMWGEDRRNSLKMTLKELDSQIKELKKQARLAPNLPEKLQFEKERRKREAERDHAWKEYDTAAKEIEINKDQLIDTIEKKLNQNIREEVLFTVEWTLE